jgi:hypothetical protein
MPIPLLFRNAPEGNDMLTTNRSRPPVREHLLDVLEQGMGLIEGLDDRIYARQLDELGLSSVGEHYRHHLEHVALLTAGARVGTVDYDQRARNALLSGQVRFALDETVRLIEATAGLADLDEDRPIEVLQRTSLSDPVAGISSSLRREWAFLCSHAVHHYAIISIALRAQGILRDTNIGVASSTRYHAGQRG